MIEVKHISKDFVSQKKYLIFLTERKFMRVRETER